MFGKKISVEEHEAALEEKVAAYSALESKVEEMSSQLTTMVADLEEAHKNLNLLNSAKADLEKTLEEKEAELIALNEKMKNYSSSTQVSSEGDKEGDQKPSFETSFDLEAKKLKRK
jgi:chromosome segregation ATPase